MPLKISLKPEERIEIDGKVTICSANSRQIDLVIMGDGKVERCGRKPKAERGAG